MPLRIAVPVGGAPIVTMRYITLPNNVSNALRIVKTINKNIISYFMFLI